MVPAVAKKVNGEVMTADAESHERQQQRIGAGGDADALCCTAVPGDFRLQGTHMLAQDELLAGAHAFDDRHDFGAYLGELRLKIE